MEKICYVTTIAATLTSFFLPQLKYLSEHNFDVTVICAPDDDLEEFLGSKVRFIPVAIPRGINVIQSITATRKLYKIFKDEKFDMVQYSTPNAALYAAIAGKCTNIAVRNYHLMGFRYLGFCGLKAAVFKHIEKFVCRLSTHIECVSKSNLQFGLKDHIFLADKATVVWNGSSGGVDLERFNFKKRDTWRAEIRKQLGFINTDFVFGFVGRVTGDKGINEILEAFERINGCKLLLLGDIENQKTIDESLLQTARADERIVFSPFTNDVEKYYAAIDVLLLPSYREGFGMVIAEAAAMGTPAIISDISGPIDVVIRNKTALVVPARNSAALNKAMEKMRSNPIMVQHMAELAHEFITRKFNSEILCRKIFDRKKILMHQRKG